MQNRIFGEMAQQKLRETPMDRVVNVRDIWRIKNY